jgi:hypothetical protein
MEEEILGSIEQLESFREVPLRHPERRLRVRRTGS